MESPPSRFLSLAYGCDTHCPTPPRLSKHEPRLPHVPEPRPLPRRRRSQTPRCAHPGPPSPDRPREIGPERIPPAAPPARRQRRTRGRREQVPFLGPDPGLAQRLGRTEGHHCETLTVQDSQLPPRILRTRIGPMSHPPTTFEA